MIPVPLFVRSPSSFFEGSERTNAIGSLQAYESKTGFHFDRFAYEGQGHPNEITYSDLAGVGMLSVSVPAYATLWLMGEGAKRVSDLLAQIKPEWRVWDDEPHLAQGSSAWNLWDVIRTRDGLGPCGMGPTLVSKLLAMKRPHLIPVRDSRVCWTLFGRDHDENFDDWAAWRNELRSPQGEQLRSLVAEVQNEAGYPDTTSVLRIIDIVVWSASDTVHGVSSSE
jgi:hypothetical protein